MSKKMLHHLGYAIIAVAVVYFGAMHGPALYRLCSSREAINAFLSGSGIWAPVMFVVLTAAQVIVAPIPAIVLSLAGGYVFGFVPGFLLNLLGLLAGSLLAFALARRFGRPLVERLVGAPTYQRLDRAMQGKGIFAVALVFLLPFMPDDALCFLAALTPMRPRVFAFLVVTCRGPGALVATLTGAGTLNLPWYLWAIAGGVALALLFLGWRHGDALEKWTLRLADSLQGS